MKSSLCICFLALTTFALPSVNMLLEKVDFNQNMTSDIKARVVLTQKKADQGTKITEMNYYRRDEDNSFLIVMTAPPSEKGNGYLRIDDNFWMYRKNTRTFQHVNRDESIGGSDATAQDFETRNLTELYKPATDSAGNQIISEEMLGKIPVYKFEVVAQVNDVAYPRKTYWVRKDNYLPLKEQAYSGSGTLMITAYYLNYTEIRGRYVPVKQMYIDEFEKGNKTIVEISGISLKKLDDAIFTKAYLENVSK
ncbi:MAG: outer membrane lipoprotein-sorting protein [Chitinivibrionales bacterium]|nr:outer membrane lipoprotein-sorting protein [Chitinivibrionales bacterium]